MSVDIDELLKIVGSTAPVKEKKDSKQMVAIKEFVRDAKIKTGDTKIGCSVIYTRYVRYMQGRKPMSFRQFFICFSQLFMRYRTNTLRYYKLDPSSFSMPKDYNIYKAYETETARRAKVPSSEYKYVYFNSKNKKWDAIIRRNGKPVRLGSFKIELDAAVAVKKFIEAEKSKEFETQ